MRLASRRSRSLVNLTPLIDIVFILLIFFMLASNFIRWQYLGLGIAEVDEMVVDHKKNSLLELKANDRLYLNAQEITLNDALKQIKQQLSLNSSHPIVIQASTGVSLQEMIRVLEPLQEIAGENVSLATPEDRLGDIP